MHNYPERKLFNWQGIKTADTFPGGQNFGKNPVIQKFGTIYVDN
jgi:hypothetical protein